MGIFEGVYEVVNSLCTNRFQCKRGNVVFLLHLFKEVFRKCSGSSVAGPNSVEILAILEIKWLFKALAIPLLEEINIPLTLRIVGERYIFFYLSMVFLSSNYFRLLNLLLTLFLIFLYLFQSLILLLDLAIFLRASLSLISFLHS